ncbi:MAG: serine--tRNA ligase, partial [bacterium]
MLDIKLIREKPDEVRSALTKRGADLNLFDQLLAADLQRREALTEVDRMKGERNRSSKAIGAARGKGEDTAGRESEVRVL